MLAYFIEHQQASAIGNIITIKPVQTANFAKWLKQQSVSVQNWLNSNEFTAAPKQYCLIPDEKGQLTTVVIGIDEVDSLWSYADFITRLPAGHYFYDTTLTTAQLQQAFLAWGLSSYQFLRYKTTSPLERRLVVPENVDLTSTFATLEAIYLVRDLINTPTEDMGPAELDEQTHALGEEFDAKVTSIVGNKLLLENYPAIHVVGRASSQPPRLLDLIWGDPAHPKVTLVGKGVCFDTGGLHIKTGNNMNLMKKDMGGAAHVLGLGQLIMQAGLPIRLRILIPAVENSIAGNAYRPGDVISTRSGLTVEITNTDAEGRLVLADALTTACAEDPTLLIDFATLTGAARVAVGTDIAAMFCNDDSLASNIQQAADKLEDAIWRLPLFAGYNNKLRSAIADLNNAPADGYGGAISAALFLQKFVKPTIPWLHFDMMAWNLSNKPGRPEGGEAMGIRAVFNYLQQTYRRSDA